MVLFDVIDEFTSPGSGAEASFWIQRSRAGIRQLPMRAILWAKARWARKNCGRSWQVVLHCMVVSEKFFNCYYMYIKTPVISDMLFECLLLFIFSLADIEILVRICYHIEIYLFDHILDREL